jgi:DNA polymerase-1
MKDLLKQNKKRVLLIDAHSLIHRSFHALPPLTSPDGRATGALYGVASTLLKILKEKKPDYVVAALDRPEPTFKKEQFEDYKAHRPKAPDELISQIKESRELFKKFGIYTCEVPGYEGDDIIGMFSEKFSEMGGAYITILTGDLDTLQLVKDEVIEVETFKKGINDIAVYDEVGVKKRFGVTPEHIPDYKGLVGDQSDNIPGIPGVGPKTAAQLISEYGSVENIFRHITEKNPLYKKIVGHQDVAILSKKLATIERQVPIRVLLDEATYAPPKNEVLIKYFSGLGFESLIKRLGGENNQKNEAGIKSETIKTNGGLSVVYDWKKELRLGQKTTLTPRSVFDIKIAAWLLNPDEKDFSIEGVLKKFGGDVSRAYAELSEKINSFGLTKIFHEIEIPLIPVLVEIEKVGILCDEKELLSLKNALQKELVVLETEITSLAGEQFNINSPQQVGQILFKKLGIKNGKKKKTKTGMSSTAESVLLELKNQHPIIEKILVYREDTKILSTYVVPLIEFAKEDSKHRIHTTYLQTGTATGRLSSEKPNLQNIPQESRWSKSLRKAFIPEHGFSLVSFDYSQLELRLLAHISEDKKLSSAFWNKKDIHNLTASQIFNIDESLITPELRRVAKTLNFGVAYGMGARAFSATSGISLEDARRFINEYFFDFPGVKRWQEKTKEMARNSGIIRNENGRIRIFPRNTKNQWALSEIERAAINMPVQSLGADIIKRAMIKIEDFIREKNIKSSVRIILTIHDELIFEIHDDILKTVVDPIKKIMESSTKLSVPLLVDVKMGKNWGEMKKYN